MNGDVRTESLLKAWVTLSGIIKNSRITTGLQYNEAIVMNILYSKFCEDGEGVVSVKDITAKTRMLKSLVNRTVNSLEAKGFLERCQGTGDKRVAYVKCAKEKLDVFLKVHDGSLAIAEKVIGIIGEEDSDAFIRLVEKIEKADFSL